MSLESIISMFTGGGLGDIEKSASDLLARLEKLGVDVIGSNGNVIEAVVSLAQDFATVKLAVADLKTIVDDVKALAASTGTASTASTVVVTGAPATVAATPSPVLATHVAASPAPSAVSSLLSAMGNAMHELASADPFAAKPLPKASA